jgi:RNA polymerase sigma-70 factor (ECF subfamily)
MAKTEVGSSLNRPAASELEADETLTLRVAQREFSSAHWERAQAAFAELYARHAGALLAYVRSRALAADYEDLHQTTWLRVWEQLPRHFHGGNFRAWLFQIARNQLVDRIRRRKPSALIDEDVAAGGPEPLAAAIDSERTAALRECIEALGKQDAMLVRRMLSGQSYRDICNALDISSNTAYKTLHRAKAKLRVCLKRRGA